MLIKVISGLIAATIIISSEWFSPFIWFLMVCGIAIIGNYELQKIIEEKKYRHSYKLITSFIFLFLLATYIAANLPVTQENFLDNVKTLLLPNNEVMTPEYWKANIANNIVALQNLVMGSAFLLLIIVNLNYVPRVSIGDVSFGLMRIVYLGFFPSYLILLRSMPHGAGFLLTILLSSGFSDIFAFFTGKKFGRHKLLPEISPNKTVEGAIGGSISCMATCFIGCTLLIGIPWYHSLILGLITSVISQMGDLIESLFKRDVGKKDSGDLIPGHGGMLDRVDSYIFIGFTAYFYLLYFVY